MDMHIYTVAVIGLGRIAWSSHLPNLTAHPEQFKVIAVVDPMAERCKESQEKFAVPYACSDIDELLRTHKPEIAVVCSPTLYHKDQVIQLMKAGIDVFCDKPAAPCAGDVRAMFDAAKATGRKLMIFQPTRVSAKTTTALEIIRSGKLGKLYQIKYNSSSYVRRSDWQAFRKNGGGMLLNYGAHFVDLMMYLTGERLIPQFCSTACVTTLGDAEDVVKAVLKAPVSGILCDLDISQASAYSPYEIMLRGDLGTAWYQGELWHVRYCNPESFQKDLKLCDQFAAPGRKYNQENIQFITEELPAPDKVAPIESFNQNFYKYLRNEEKPIVPPEDTVALLEILEECRTLAEKC